MTVQELIDKLTKLNKPEAIVVLDQLSSDYVNGIETIELETSGELDQVVLKDW